jgi:hypothetical protein
VWPAWREARIGTVRFLRDAPIARAWEATKMLSAFQVKVAHLGTQADAQTAQTAAAELLFTGLGIPRRGGLETGWRPPRRSTDEVDSLGRPLHREPSDVDVVIAAAQTLARDDLSLIIEEELPSRSGLLVLPHPLLVKGDQRQPRRRPRLSLAHPGPDAQTRPGHRRIRSRLRRADFAVSRQPRPGSSRFVPDFEAAARAQGTRCRRCCWTPCAASRSG